MNFLEALAELNEGRCEEIVSVEENIRIGENSQVYLTGPNDGCYCATPDAFLSEWTLVNPKPVMEEVEVKWWIIRSSSLHMFHERTDAEDFCKHTATPKSHIIEMKVVDRVEVKPKVKRRVECDNTSPLSLLIAYGIPDDAKFFAEWSE
jgi:hypothetical protein